MLGYPEYGHFGTRLFQNTFEASMIRCYHTKVISPRSSSWSLWTLKQLVYAFWCKFCH